MPARNISLQYMLLSIPAKLSKATEGKESNTNLCVGQPAHETHDPKPLTRPATCTECGPIVDWEALKTGVKQGSTYAVVEKSDIAEAKAEFTKQYKDVMNFVAHPAGAFLAQTAPGDKINYAIPASKQPCMSGCKGCPVCRYQLLVRLVAENPDVAFVSLYTPVSVTGLYVLSARDGVLVLEERVRTQSLKAAPEIAEAAEFKDKFYAMLEGSLEVEPYDPEDYEDKYAAAVRELADKAEQIVSVTTEAKPTAITSVQSDEEIMAKMAALKKAS